MSLMSPVAAATSPVAAATTQLMPVVIGPMTAANGGGGGGSKDSRWLTLEVCREFARSKCSRSDEECKYAHPPPHVETQNGRVMCCFDSIKGKCQRKDPPCKYLHPPQHLKEILLQNGRQNLINKNLQLQATLQPILSMPHGMVPLERYRDSCYGYWTLDDRSSSSGSSRRGTDQLMDFMVYEQGTSGALKQTATIIPSASAYSNGIVLPGPTATPVGGQYLTMLPQPTAGASHHQYMLPAGATATAAGYPCYGSALTGFSPTAFYPTTIDGSPASVSLHPGSLISHTAAPNRTWSIANLQAAAGCYGLPAAAAASGATIHTIPYDIGATTQYQQQQQQQQQQGVTGSTLSSSSATSAAQLNADATSVSGVVTSADGIGSPGPTSTSIDPSTINSSMPYCQPSIYYKRPMVEMLTGGMGRKRLLEQSIAGPGQPGGEDLILGMTALPNGMVPVFKRPALIDAKTGLPFYQQIATAPSYQQMAALGSIPQFQPQQFVSVSLANPTQLQRY